MALSARTTAVISAPLEDRLLGWNAADWYAFGQVLLAVGALAAGVWGVFIYNRRRREAAAHWLHAFFLTFYTDPQLIAARDAISYDYDALAPILELRATDRHVVLSPSERESLRLADLVLNYFEEIVYLVRERQLRPDDRDLFFSYWLDLLLAPTRAAMRRYIACCGYDQLARWTSAPDYEYLVIPSASSVPVERVAAALEGLTDVGTCSVPLGSLGPVGPSLPGTPASLQARLIRVENRATLHEIDAAVGYDAGSRARSLVLRRCVAVTAPVCDAWLYLPRHDRGDGESTAKQDDPPQPLPTT